MKEIKWDNPNKMHIETGYKTFDKQTNLITTGNVYANTQMSSYIRPYKEIECNHTTFEEGHLMNFDLQYFPGIPKIIKDILTDKDRTESYILYRFFIVKKGHAHTIGYAVTDKNHNLIYRYTVEGTYFWKRDIAMQEIVKYISN